MKPWPIKSAVKLCRLCSSTDLYPNRGLCRACYTLQMKVYRETHDEPAERNAYQRAWRDKNREKYREYQREYGIRRRASG